MNYENFEEMALNSLAEIMERFRNKNAEYASTDDVFSNFKRAAGGLSYHCKEEQVAWEYAVKHLQSLKDMIASNNPCSPETIDEKIGDVIAYMLLIKGMLYKRTNYNPTYPNFDTTFNSDVLDKLVYTLTSEE